MIVEACSSPHRIAGRDGRVPAWIVVHTTVGSFPSAGYWFEDPSSGVSAHYLVGLEGRVAAFVGESDAAQHAGRVVEPTASMARRAEADGESPNLTSIGIELVDNGDPGGVERTDVQYATAARLVAQVCDRWGIPADLDHVVGHREIAADTGCPGNLDINRIRREARAWLEGGPADRPMTVGLLPVRDGEALLPGWLDSAATWCEAVVALDDGSTDGTRALLEAAPIVRIVLTNPPRSSAAGWHDGLNRRRLLEAAAGLAPDWIVQVDADERIEPDDAAVLRDFLATDALPGLAYGLLHRRAWGENQIDPTASWVYRVFAWEPGQELPDAPLHFHPLPVTIPRQGWVRTTIALQNLGAADPKSLLDRERKYREADPDGRYPMSFGGVDAPPRLLVAKPSRMKDLPALLSPGGLEALADAAVGDPSLRPLLVVLLPVRNGEEDLPGWFENVRGFADAVIALDDGSTDGTRTFLESEPLVRAVLAHPPRLSAAGWDDARNRQELLDAAAGLAPRWVLFLDVDERVDPQDAVALREHLASDQADREAAYGFLVHRMIGEEAFDRDDLWVFRAFAWRPGQLLPEGRLHLVPVPVSIPASRWRTTTVRIRHLASLTESRRRARAQKYGEADPEHEFQNDYDALLAPPGDAHDWVSRPTGLPVLLDQFDPTRIGISPEDEPYDPDAPVLSAIVIAREDAERIERVVGSVLAQETPEPFETIVVVSGSPRTADVVRRCFPYVTLVELPDPVFPGAARNAGLELARGDFVSFPGSHIELPQGSLAARIRAHERGYPMITGSTLNGTRSPAGWAAYFLDHSSTLPGRPSEELEGPPVHCSYEREILLRVGGFPADLRAGEDTFVNHALAQRGYQAFRAADVIIVHSNPCRTTRALVRHHFSRGRGFGRILIDATPSGDRVIRRDTIVKHLIAYLPRRIGSTTRNVEAWGGPQLGTVYRRVLPLVCLGTVSAWAGTWYELLRGARGGRRTS